MNEIVISERVNHHHRDTITTLFTHPTSRNLKWVDVISMLNAVGSVEDKADGRIRVALGDEVEGFEVHEKDVTVEQVADLRRMLRNAGIVEVPGESSES